MHKTNKISNINKNNQMNKKNNKRKINLIFIIRINNGK